MASDHLLFLVLCVHMYAHVRTLQTCVSYTFQLEVAECSIGVANRRFRLALHTQVVVHQSLEVITLRGEGEEGREREGERERE